MITDVPGVRVGHWTAPPPGTDVDVTPARPAPIDSPPGGGEAVTPPPYAPGPGGPEFWPNVGAPEDRPPAVVGTPARPAPIDSPPGGGEAVTPPQYAPGFGGPEFWPAPGRGRTGCTVVLLPAGTVASGEVRGGAPGTREFELLRPERLVAHVNAVVLSGGSAFGLAACDGVVQWCVERGIGFPTSGGPVPIVVGMVLYDLPWGEVRPDAAAGRAACEAAVAGPFEVGLVGAGAGATVRKWTGLAEDARPGGLGTATVRAGDLVVSALFAVNAFGDLPDGSLRLPAPSARFNEQTTIGVVATNAAMDKVGCLLTAQSAHDGLARALDPAHLSVDGDGVVACAVGGVEAPVDQVRVLAAMATELAIRSAL